MKRIKRIVGYALPIYLIQLVTSILPNAGWAIRLRGAFLRPFFKQCGKGLRVAKGVTLNNTENLTIGEHVYFGHYTWINAIGGCHIGSYTQIAPFTVIATSNHSWNGYSFCGTPKKGTIRIGNGSWVAAHCTITAGTIIGEGTIVAANSVLTANEYPAHSLLAGVPAKIIKYYG